MKATTPVSHYRITPANPAAHLFEVSLTIDDPDPAGQRFMLPTWIPGSYMIREFARHIVSIAGVSNGRAVGIEKIDKATWQATPVSGPLTVTYQVYAWDLSVRAAHLDETHAFFNGPSVFLLALGHEERVCTVDILPPVADRYAGWRVATALTPVKASPVGEPKAFGTYAAANYDELIDHPVEMGAFSHATFEACGVTHHIAITGRHRTDMNRLCADLKRVCEWQIKLFEPATAAAPMGEYWFLVMAVGDGYGGLEHRASTALICNRDDLPNALLAGDRKIVNGYRRFLGLASHEYFHTWNVKRIKPEAFIPYDLTRENYTRQLWFFEGFTSYYDDLALVRSGLIEPLAYLEMIAENIGRVTSQAGRLKQSVAESSFDAWVKYYRQDENSPNAIVSYYQKGSIIGLALDLTIRLKTGGTKSLDDVMRALWNQYGKAGTGVPEGGVELVASQVSGVDLQPFFDHALRGTSDLDLATLFAGFAIEMQWKVPGQQKADDPAPSSLGAKITSEPNGDARLAQVFDGGAAQIAGLSAGDIVVAVDGLRITAGTLERRIKSYAPGSALVFTAFRRDELMSINVTLQPQPAQICSLTTADTPIDAKARRNAWLMG
jgi:predicted metalloprotease with PDZ domain